MNVSFYDRIRSLILLIVAQILTMQKIGVMPFAPTFLYA